MVWRGGSATEGLGYACILTAEAPAFIFRMMCHQDENNSLAVVDPLAFALVESKMQYHEIHW